MIMLYMIVSLHRLRGRSKRLPGRTQAPGPLRTPSPPGHLKPIVKHRRYCCVSGRHWKVAIVRTRGGGGDVVRFSDADGRRCEGRMRCPGEGDLATGLIRRWSHGQKGGRRGLEAGLRRLLPGGGLGAVLERQRQIVADPSDCVGDGTVLVGVAGGRRGRRREEG